MHPGCYLARYYKTQNRGQFITLKRNGRGTKMADAKIPKTLIKLIEKWMNNKKTGSLQINFVKGEIINVFKNRAVNLNNNENQV
jgi:hypothetical protein